MKLTDIDDLQDRIQELESAIREHRSQKADDRCIEDDDRLYAVLGDGIKCDRRVGSKEEMLKNCSRFIDRRCEAGGWPTYAELEATLNDEREHAWEQRKLLNQQIDQLQEIADSLSTIVDTLESENKWLTAVAEEHLRCIFGTKEDE